MPTPFMHLDFAEQLRATAGLTTSAGWLPFATDRQLHGWRDMLVSQLRPGGMSQTVTIYVERMQIRPETFGARLADPSWMEAQVFDRVAIDEVTKALARGCERAAAFVNQYKAPAMELR